jgi:hypothetical protein
MRPGKVDARPLVADLQPVGDLLACAAEPGFDAATQGLMLPRTSSQGVASMYVAIYVCMHVQLYLHILHRRDSHASSDSSDMPNKTLIVGRVVGSLRRSVLKGPGPVPCLLLAPVPVPPLVARTDVAGLSEEAICTAPRSALTSPAPFRWCGCTACRSWLLVKTVGVCGDTLTLAVGAQQDDAFPNRQACMACPHGASQPYQSQSPPGLDVQKSPRD